MPTGIPLLLIDAFTSEPFAGNPAAVVLLQEDGWPDAGWMQRVAGEMNQSETAFVLPTGEATHFGLRWFTPAAEVELCGHATLASMHALRVTRRISSDASVTFETVHSGGLVCRSTGDAGGIEMSFPALTCNAAEPPVGLLDTLGLPGDAEVVRSNFGPYDWVIELANVRSVAAASPAFSALAEFDCRGVCVTAAGGDGVDITSRFFAPRLRVAEDPVTGSLHCVLAPYYAARLGTRLTCRQASPRGGIVLTRYDADTSTVTLAGHAHLVATGTLLA